MSDGVTTTQAAQRLGVTTARARALIASGALAATRVGHQWLIDRDSLDRQRDLVAAGATGRSFAPRIGWAAAALCDGSPDGLAPDERYRLRYRLVGLEPASASACAQVQRWLSRRAQSVHRYRVGERDIETLLRTDGVMATGISAVATYGLGLGVGGSADAYVTDRTCRQLVRDFVLIDSARGNLTLRVIDTEALNHQILDTEVAPRLIVGVDLAEDTDARSRAAGCGLITEALRGVRPARKA